MSIGRGQSNFGTSPFHKGEQALQQAAGVRAKMEAIGQSFIRDHMPEQHSQFYQQLPYLFVSTLDNDNRPWAHILYGESGFISAPSNKQLSVKLNPQSFTILKSQGAGSAVGLLGIVLDTRRRNRASTQLVSIDENKMELAVKQTFGNCPKYIHPRQLVKNKYQVKAAGKQIPFNRLDALAIELIEQADTFFVATYYPGFDAEKSQGMDISHRGGAAGFVRTISNNQLMIPDYAGNNFLIRSETLCKQAKQASCL